MEIGEPDHSLYLVGELVQELIETLEATLMGDQGLRSIPERHPPREHRANQYLYPLVPVWLFIFELAVEPRFLV